MTEATLDSVFTHVVYPEVPEGQAALSLCGEEWKPSEWGIDASLNHPICVDCTLLAVRLLREADAAKVVLLDRVADLAQAVVTLIEEADQATPYLDLVQQHGREFVAEQERLAVAARQKAEEKALRKAEAKAAKQAVKDAAAKEAKAKGKFEKSLEDASPEDALLSVMTGLRVGTKKFEARKAEVLAELKAELEQD